MDLAGSSARGTSFPDEPFADSDTPAAIAPLAVRPARTFAEIDVRVDAADATLWCMMRPSGRPCYTYPLMNEVAALVDGLRASHATRRDGDAELPRYFVFGSRVPGIYSLGGDLAHFVDRISAGDLDAMRRYAHACVERQYDNSRAFGLPMITIALVQGDALGGGFEHCLATDLLVAERSARLGLPEVLFNLFPGMGAYSFITRRLDRRTAERLILSGKVFTGEELHAMGLVDILAEDGRGEEAVRRYIAENRRRFHVERAIYEARRLATPVTLDELLRVTDLWAETAMTLTDRELKIMDRLRAAQDKRLDAQRSPLTLV